MNSPESQLKSDKTDGLFASHCVLMDADGNDTPALLEALSSIYGGPSTVSASNLVLCATGKAASILRKRGMPSAITMNKIFQEGQKNLQPVRSVLFYEPILGSPGDFDLKNMLSVLLQFEENTIVAVVLNRDRFHVIEIWNLLVRSGFVPVSLVEKQFVESEHLTPAQDLGEALERMGTELAVTHPQLATADKDEPRAIHFPESLSERSALALTQHPDGAVRTRAILHMGPEPGTPEQKAQRRS